MTAALAVLDFLWRFKWQVIIVLLATYIVWLRYDVRSLNAAQKTLTQQAGIALADSHRWQKAAADRDAAIAQRDAALAQQSAEVAKWRADAQRANSAAQEALESNRQLQEQAASLTAEIEGKADAHPDEVRALGPLALSYTDSLF